MNIELFFDDEPVGEVKVSDSILPDIVQVTEKYSINWTHAKISGEMVSKYAIYRALESLPDAKRLQLCADIEESK